MDAVIIDAGTLAFSEEDMTATGLLVPYGVKCRSNLGEFEVSSGVFTFPEDTTGIGLNVEHKREDVVGAITKAWEQPEGIMSTFKFSQTDEGRAAFSEAKSGKRKHLSAEVAKVTISDGKATGGVLFGSAVVERPAFAGATLLAAEDTETIAVDQNVAAEGDPEHLVIAAEVLPTDVTVTAEGESRTYTPEAEAPAEDNPKENIMTASAVEAVAGASVPATLLANAPVTQSAEVDLGSVFANMALVKNGAPETPDALTLLAELSDIKAEAAGGLTVANSGVIQPAWVGKLWQGRRYQRKYLDLLTHLYGGISLGGRKGFKLDQGTALVTKWSGNKTEIGSGTATTSVTSATRQAYGYAADVAREWWDLDGGADIIAAFFEGVVDSYAKVTDLDALTAVFNAAARTSTALDRLVAPGTFPSVDGHDYESAMGMIIQGIEAISDADDDASFAIVNPVAWSQILYTPKDLVPEYVSFNVGAGTGEGSADGKVKIQKAPAAAFVGLDPAKPQVIVGAKAAVEFREQGQTPIQVDALDIAKGGVDKAVIGYLETFVVRPESLALIGTKTA
ncbi:hypothetical protein ACTU6V_05375 [Microbacterium sp. A204]|uniref:hypothetical protein n=1 Tax=Microbacterium sp. A204 TaxID=3457321 RepID=UPI003FD32A5E